MLALTRKPGETIVIGDDIRITVVSIGPGRVKLGVVAPPEIRVDREEIHVARQGIGAAAPVSTLVEVDGAVLMHNRTAEPAPAADDRLHRLGRSPFPRKPR